MKKLFALLLSMLLVLPLAACGVPAPQTPDSGSQTAEGTHEAQEEQKKPTDAMPELPPASPASEMTAEQFDEIWTLLFGYWNAAEGRFAVIDAMDSNTAVFSDGIWETSYGRYGTISLYGSDFRSEHENELTLSVFYHAVEATEMEDARPERTETVVIDYSGLEQDGKIRIKIGEDEWRQYMFAGQTEEEANQTVADNTFPN